MNSGGGTSAFGVIIYLAIIALILAGMWKVFEKAGKPGWAAIIPIYNLIVLLEIVAKPLWWIVLFLIPLVNIVVIILVSMDLAVCFSKSKGWGFGLLCILPFVGYPMLGFGPDKYTAPAKSA
jgi:hypothetical protein